LHTLIIPLEQYHSSSAPNNVAKEENIQNQKKQMPTIKMTTAGRIRIERPILDNHNLPIAKYHHIDITITNEETMPETNKATPILHEKYRFSSTYFPFYNYSQTGSFR
tara:strand:+ start:1358 stop:1681 length:324 start_codon:yes stop_codon:yes gene_type:complete